jgi:two-component system sensor histidine kinase KdpD
MAEPRRPTAEEMLARLAEDEDADAYAKPKERRGKLHVFLGAAPGVGKTFAMLNEGRRLQDSGVDVVCGYIEPHGRAETTALIGDLEVVPRSRVSYRGVIVEEMDTDAILARKPQVCLVDELAHTNAPGSPREKRYEDIELLLEAGIDVLSTLNIQHLESLNDIVESITGVQVRETVPDEVLDNPTTVHLVDLHPEALRTRLREGKIYPPDRVRQAADNFFRTGNLTALRELALRTMAEGVESSLERYMAEHDIAGPWAATETVLACVAGRPLSGRVLRHAWRLAHGLDADLIAVHVSREALEALPGEQRRAIEGNLELAEDLGAETLVIVSNDTVGAILAVARERNVTQLVIGHSARSRWQERLGRSLVHELIRAARGYDIHVVADREVSTS